MDIVKTKQPPRVSPRQWVMLTVLLLLVVIGVLVIQPKPVPQVEREKVLLATVQQGNLDVMVDGYGVLRSQKQTLITALTPATIAELVLRPGAQVSVGSVIMRLENPDVLREMESAQNSLAQEQANLRRLKLTNARELLNEQSVLAELTANLKAANLRRDAEESLAVKGVIPQITFKTSLLQQEQIAQRVDYQQTRIAQLKNVNKEAQLIQEKQIDQAESRYKTMQERAEKLTVKANLDGVLQRLPVELGQSVPAGKELALVGSDKDLVALIKVSQSKAEQLRVGQKAFINIRMEKAEGAITRIAPEVHEGTVEVEVSFIGRLPPSARPELNVDAQIETASLQNALYIERPINVQGHTNATIFCMDAGRKTATKKLVSFGADAGKYIQVLQGLEQGQTVVLSDLPRVKDANQIELIH